MFLIKAGTNLQIQGRWSRWIPYATKEDELYEKEEVWDAVGVYNGREDIPDWAVRNIKEHNKVVINRAGKYAMVRPQDIQFLD